MLLAYHHAKPLQPSQAKRMQQHAVGIMSAPQEHMKLSCSWTPLFMIKKLGTCYTLSARSMQAVSRPEAMTAVQNQLGAANATPFLSMLQHVHLSQKFCAHQLDSTGVESKGTFKVKWMHSHGSFRLVKWG